jgi:hypothetical protein
MKEESFLVLCARWSGSTSLHRSCARLHMRRVGYNIKPCNTCIILNDASEAWPESKARKACSVRGLVAQTTMRKTTISSQLCRAGQWVTGQLQLWGPAWICYVSNRSWSQCPCQNPSIRVVGSVNLEWLTCQCPRGRRNRKRSHSCVSSQVLVGVVEFH